MKRQDRIELLKALSEGMLIVVFLSLAWLSLMSWRGIERYNMPQPPFLAADKGELVRLTGPAMAIETARLNEKMEAKAK